MIALPEWIHYYTSASYQGPVIVLYQEADRGFIEKWIQHAIEHYGNAFIVGPPHETHNDNSPETPEA